MDFGVTTLRSIMLETEGRKPTERQIRAVENLVENGGVNRGDAIRRADYSEAVAKNPERVFGSPTVQKVLEKLGIPDESEAIATLHRNMKAKVPVNFVFPPFREPNEPSKEGENVGEKFGERLTDADIREYLASGGVTVSKIVHGDLARRVYGYAPAGKIQNEAADKILKVFGAYAPDKVLGKYTHTVGIMSMKELRQRMRKAGVSVVQEHPLSVSE